MSGQVELATPLWLWLWPVLLIVALLWRHLAGSGAPAGLAIGTTAPRHFLHPLAGLLGSTARGTGRLPGWKLLAFGGALSCMVLAMAQPVRIGERLPEPPPQRDIVLIVDTSVAMLLRDYELEGQRVKRIDLLKQVLDGLVQRLVGDRIGVVVFGETAHTLVPLTDDHALVRGMLGRIDTDIAGRFSAVGDAVAMAVREANRVATGERRILMLFTDAQLPAGKIAPLAAAELAAEAQLPLYTVAIGAASREAEESAVAGLVYHPANLELLQRLAQRTGAGNYHADSTTALEQAVRDITARDAQTRQGEPEFVRLPLYHWPLLMAVLLLLLGLLELPRRRPQP